MLQWGELSAPRVQLSEKGKCLVSPFLKGRGPFIVARQLDDCKLFISISKKGFT
jgi:hypothetical protein